MFIISHISLSNLWPDGSLYISDSILTSQVIEISKCTCLIGASAVPGAFSPDILQLMLKFTEKPLIMALSNPTSKAECTAEQAYQHTKVINKFVLMLVKF
ncbi:unnamed protein product [Protopolystoma xenopodis]|uniref:Malic enzyme NAD-binding domain-containing protein n=1 Tax=Protopolystoma xenopodis TaxID=117903 RepID=A0A3S5BT83_9PLAT|nr:unnamed protein product [Protopolystoma xenopodis]